MAQRPLAGLTPRRPINTKISDVVRARLEEAAAASDRTLSHEIEYRLEQSMRDESLYGSPETARVLQKLAAYITNAERLQQRKLLDIAGGDKDLRFDAHLRWLLGEIIGFERSVKKQNPDREVEQMLADNEANRDADD